MPNSFKVVYQAIVEFLPDFSERVTNAIQQRDDRDLHDWEFTEVANQLVHRLEAHFLNALVPDKSVADDPRVGELFRIMNKARDKAKGEEGIPLGHTLLELSGSLHAWTKRHAERAGEVSYDRSSPVRTPDSFLLPVRIAIERYFDGVVKDDRIIMPGEGTSGALKAQLIKAIDKAIYHVQDTKVLPRPEKYYEEIYRHLATALDWLVKDHDKENTNRLLQKLFTDISELIHSPPGIHEVEAIAAEMIAADQLPAESESLDIIVDSDVDPGAFAEFLAELSAIYSDLSGGDELIIREGKIPVAEEVFA